MNRNLKKPGNFGTILKNNNSDSPTNQLANREHLKDLADLSGGDMKTAIAIIHQSIKKGWRGFFTLRKKIL